MPVAPTGERAKRVSFVSHGAVGQQPIVLKATAMVTSSGQRQPCMLSLHFVEFAVGARLKCKQGSARML
jgi:hypothetical protein